MAADLSASNSVDSETSHCNLGICVERVDGRERRESMDCWRVENRWRATKTETRLVPGIAGPASGGYSSAELIAAVDARLNFATDVTHYNMAPNSFAGVPEL